MPDEPVDLTAMIKEATDAESDRKVKAKADTDAKAAAATAATELSAAIERERAAKIKLSHALDPNAVPGGGDTKPSAPALLHRIVDAIVGMISTVLSKIKVAAPYVLAAAVLLGLGYLVATHFPFHPQPPAPAPDDPSLTDQQKLYRKAILDNIKLDAAHKAQLSALAANYEKMSAEIQQAVAGAGNPDFKDPAKIEAAIASRNAAAVPRVDWLPTFNAFKAILDQLDDAGKLKEAGDYVTVFNDIAKAMRSIK